MCRIAGIIEKQPTDEASHKLNSMVQSLVHGGPDDGGVFEENGVHLGHRRLSILDLSPLGHQPMPTVEGDIIITYNGEIFNFHSIREELQQKGYRFQSATDTEVILNALAIQDDFKTHQPQPVVNLAAQAGVEYSIDNPLAYIDNNITGFAHILEGCRHNSVEHLVNASSSSVYGANTTMPFAVHHNVDHSLRLFAASKKAKELMAHTYSHLYGLPTTDLRFLTIYGPWGRPNRVLFKFIKAILAGDPIQVFNHGKHRRDFTYIDDIVEGVIRVLDQPAAGNPAWQGNAPDPGTSTAPLRVYNIGNNHRSS